MGDALRIAGMMEWRTMATWRLSERLKRLERLEPSQFSHLKPLKGNKEGNGEKKREKEKKRKREKAYSLSYDYSVWIATRNVADPAIMNGGISMGHIVQ